MISESDFDDLIDIDKADRRRYAALGALAFALGASAAFLPQIGEALGPNIAKIAAGAIGAIGTQPIFKFVTISRNMDRISKIRRRWRRLKEGGDEAGESLSKVEALVWEAYK